MKVLEQLLDLIYPPSLYCICCGKIIDASRPYHLCNECFDGIKWSTGRTCRKCGKPLSSTNPRLICYSCNENSHLYDRGYTCSEYGTFERSIIFKLKYNSKSEIAEVLGEAMYDRLSMVHETDSLSEIYDCIVPIPMHPDKLGTRGYNQAALIAGRLSQLSGIEILENGLTRVKTTRALRGLSPEERRAEMRGVFALGIDGNVIEGRRILIVDDIYTTGATIDEAARVLRSVGAEVIDFMSFASGADVVK